MSTAAADGSGRLPVSSKASETVSPAARTCRTVAASPFTAMPPAAFSAASSPDETPSVRRR